MHLESAVKLHVVMPDSDPFILFGIEIRTQYSRTILTKRFNDLLVFQNKLCYFAHSFYSPGKQLMDLLPKLPLPQPSLITLSDVAIAKRKDEVSKYFQSLCDLYNSHSFNPKYPWIEMIRSFLNLNQIEKLEHSSALFIQQAFKEFKKILIKRRERQKQLRLEGYTSNLQELPNELLIYLARYLNIKDLFNLTLVNKRFRDNTEQPILWTTINLFQSKIKIEHCIFEKLCFKAQKLRQIDLRYCQFINSEAMHAISQNCNPAYLEELYLDGCENIEDISLISLCSPFEEGQRIYMDLKGGAYGLRKLSLSECRTIQNTGLSYLRKLKRLEELNILGCYSITDEGISNLVSKSKNFKKFNLSGTYVSREGLMTIKNNCLSLHTLILHGCRLLSADDSNIFKGIYVELRDDIFRFQLLPSNDTSLNSITNNILRTRSSLTIQRVAHYVCKKISLPVGSGIDIICKGKVLSSYMTLKGVEQDMWDASMLTLHYRLKAETEKIKEIEKVESLMGKMPKWLPDDSAIECGKCGDRFRVFLRKHHCRNCGKIFCDKCSSKRILIPAFGYTKHPVRVCDNCFVR